jgi:hypothetical protein
VDSETSEPTAGHACILPFDTGEEEAFSRGFEAGRLWALLCEWPGEDIEQLVHGSNAEMVLRMADALQREVRSKDVDETWMTVLFGPGRAGA